MLLQQLQILEGILRYIIFALLPVAMFSSATAMRFRLPDIPSEPAMPLSAPLPALPEACSGQPTVSGDGLRFITLFGSVDWEGRATQVQVLEPSDNCLKEAAIETVRQWKFEAVDPKTEEYWRHTFETTLIYRADETPRFEMGANDVLVRYPPRYPEQCFAKARSVEVVAVTFDVTEEGITKNIESVFSTNPCLTKAAEKSVEKWDYAPRVINGVSYPRKNVYTDITFELADNRHQSTRRKISQAFMSVGIMLDRKLDPRIALEKIALIEKEYGEELRDSERATFLRYRGAAKIDALDYQGALEDLRASLTLEKNEATANGIRNVVTQLEAALGLTKSPE